MSEKKLCVCLLVSAVLFAATALPAVSQNGVARGDGGRSDADQNGIQLFIRFYNQKIYYLNRSEEIMIRVSVVNRSGEPFAFKLADKKVFNIGLDVKTPGNTSLDPADEFTIDRSSDQPVFFKELTVAPEEEYGVVVRLDRFSNSTGRECSTFRPDSTRGSTADRRVSLSPPTSSPSISDPPTREPAWRR